LKVSDSETHINQLPGRIRGTWQATPSKSCSQRALAAALLHKGTTRIKGLGRSDDELRAVEIIGMLGAELNECGNELVIKSRFDELIRNPSLPTLMLDCGESALCARLFTPLAACLSIPVTITGRGSLLERNLQFPTETFRRLGITLEGMDTRLPLSVRGPLNPTPVEVQAESSSQHLTGLLFAFAMMVKEPTVLIAQSLNSKPYVQLTIDLLARFGWHIGQEEADRFVVHPQKTNNYSGEITYDVEGDWSTAAFFLVAGALAGSLTVTGLDVFSAQADKAVLQALMSTGAHLSITEQQITIGAPAGNQALKPFHFDATHCPDLFPPLAVMAAGCEGISVIEGTARLENKESNRKKTLETLLHSLGVPVKLQDNLMIIEGRKELIGGETESFNDHRLAMAAGIAALRANGPVLIRGAEAVSKSCPDFFRMLDRIRV
jgi:3-phosphoshikimate 1-carboxyvinyltransferase